MEGSGGEWGTDRRAGRQAERGIAGQHTNQATPGQAALPIREHGLSLHNQSQ